MNTSYYKLVLLAGIAPGLVGCTTIYSQQRDTQRVQQRRMEELADRVNRLTEAVAGLQNSQDRLHEDVDALRNDLEKQESDLLARLAQIDGAVAQTGQVREQLKLEIVDVLTKKLVALRPQQPPPPQPRVVEGLEHVVEQGQTLSEIAAAYGVTVKAILKINNISDPNKIREGQKLIIPE